MRLILLLLISVVPLFGCAQKKIGDLLVDEKATADSLMRIQYGDELFPRYFILNTKSGGRTRTEFLQWNDTTSDSLSYYFIWYYFRFPGAKLDSSLEFEFSEGKTKSPTRGSYSDKYPGQCIKVSSTEMDSIAQREFRQPLSECVVRLYGFMDFNDSLYSILDSGHVFIQMEYDSLRYYGWKDRKVHLLRTSIVVDACTGEVVYRDLLDWKGLTYRPSPITDQPCMR